MDEMLIKTGGYIAMAGLMTVPLLAIVFFFAEWLIENEDDRPSQEKLVRFAWLGLKVWGVGLTISMVGGLMYISK